MLVTANHILHLHGAFDGFGHVSVRHPEKPDVYIMCGYMPPALVENADDLIEYYVNGSATVDPYAKKGYSERFIHGEIYKRYPDVNCVVHSHAEAVLPYATSTVPLRPVYHMGGFLGHAVPVWDIVPLYQNGQAQTMLVNNELFGASLAAKFSKYESSTDPETNVVLMKRHGYTTHGKDIPTAVFRAIYTLINAGVQTNATLLQAAANTAGMVEEASVESLSEVQATDCQKMLEATQDKSWRLWVREVEASPVYKNNV